LFGILVDPTITFLIGLSFSIIAIILDFFKHALSSRQFDQSSMVKAIDIMENVRSDRFILYSIRNSNKPLSKWTDSERKAAYNVTRAFDILGILDNTKLISRKFVDRFYAMPAKELWDICLPYTQEERKTRGEQHLWEFEQLADRVKNVKGNHPTIRKKKKWPLFPRHKYLHL